MYPKRDSLFALLYVILGLFLIAFIVAFILSFWLGVYAGITKQTIPMPKIVYVVIEFLAWFPVLFFAPQFFKKYTNLELFPFENLPNKKTMGLFILGILSVLLLNSLYIYVFQHKFPPNPLMNFKDTPSRIIILICILFIAPLVEELAFRGFLYRVFEKSLGLIYAMIVPTVLFALLHIPTGGVYKVMPMLFLGGFLVFARYKSCGLKVPILLHFINNLISSLFIMNEWGWL